VAPSLLAYLIDRIPSGQSLINSTVRVEVLRRAM
jgi:hypothetical protein